MHTHEVNFSKICIKTPKRFDNFMSGKIVYDEDKLVIDLPSVRILSSKNANETLYCKMKLLREHERFFIDLEERIVQLTVDNVVNWFKSRMNEETVDEYFQSALVMGKKIKTMLKLRIESPSVVPDADMVEGGLVDIRLRVHGVRFLKTAWWICYDIIGCTASNMRGGSLGFVTDDEDDDKCSIAGLDEECGPDGEERERMRTMYMDRLREEIDGNEGRLQAMKGLYEQLESGAYTFAAFDAIENLLQ